jgi:hypothetical protein
VASGSDALSDLIGLRARLELLEQDLSEAVHLIYWWLVSVAACQESEFRREGVRALRAKFFQMPQGCPLGERLIELDKQNGYLLESKGILLSRWVYEPREASQW